MVGLGTHTGQDSALVGKKVTLSEATLCVCQQIHLVNSRTRTCDCLSHTAVSRGPELGGERPPA